MRYFAYGSNMVLPQLRGRCPGADFLFAATLRDRRIAFTRTSTKRECGVADIVKTPGKVVWGAVFQIPDGDMAALDEAEGVHVSASRRGPCQVFRDNDPTATSDAETYFAGAMPGEHLPNAAYLAVLIAGATEWALPADYGNALRRIPIRCG